MKKRFLPLLLVCTLALAGCGRQDEARFNAFSEALRERNDLVMTAQVRAVYDDRECSFTLRYAETTDGGCTVEQWKTVYAGDWQTDDTIQVWNGLN